MVEASSLGICSVSVLRCRCVSLWSSSWPLSSIESSSAFLCFKVPIYGSASARQWNVSMTDLLFSQYALSVASISGAVINLVVIMILGYLYEIIAFKLTQWGSLICRTRSNRRVDESLSPLWWFVEMHRTQTDFDNHFTIKVFLFQFVNIYSSIFYIAFIKGKWVYAVNALIPTSASLILELLVILGTTGKYSIYGKKKWESILSH